MDENPMLDVSCPEIRVERSGAVLRITLDRADKANALTSDMMFALASAVRGARVGELVVLQSASPRLFCAGADIAQFVSGPEALARQEQGLLALIDAMAQSPAPLLAVARGRASGAGAILVALADVVVAADDLQVAAPEFVFGMYPIVVEAVLQSRLWPALVQRLCTGVGAIDAQQALQLGLVTEVLPQPQFDDAAATREHYYLERLAGLQALRGSRRVSAATAEMRQQLQAVAPLMLENFAAPGVRERIQDYVAGLRKR
jgi:enoyl-CoA hydratase/carnithine racemase